MWSEEIRRKAAEIRLLALDSDGVLTDGGVYFDGQGQESRRFDIKDGYGLKRIMGIGIAVAIISGSNSRAILHRAKSLGITEVYIGAHDKLAVLFDICKRLDLTFSQVAYMGDDIPDIPVLSCVALPCTPSDATLEVQRQVAVITPRRGGHGAVRDICDLIYDCSSTITPSSTNESVS